MRLDKLLSDAGFGTRTEVKKAVKQGAVQVDGETVKDPKTKVDPTDQNVVFKGMSVNYQEHVYLMLNKPKGVISATEDHTHKTVIDLIASDWGHMDVFPIGRLDKDTEGLLLLTTDGQFSHELMAPKKHVSKEYRAHVSGVVTEADHIQFKQGVELADGYVTKPATLHIEQSGRQSLVTIEIMEGKYHQIKRMFEAVGKQVVQLERVRIGSLILDSELNRGEFRELTEMEKDLAKKR